MFHLTSVDVTKLYGFAQFLRGGSHEALARWGTHRKHQVQSGGRSKGKTWTFMVVFVERNQ